MAGRERADFTVRVVGQDGADVDVFVVNGVVIDTDGANPGDIISYDGDTFVLITPGGGSLPPGGDDGQVLTKQSGADGDADWEDPSGLPPGGDADTVLTKLSGADGDADWVELPDVDGLPGGGDTNAVLTKVSGSDGDANWIIPACVTDSLTIRWDRHNMVLDDDYVISSEESCPDAAPGLLSPGDRFLKFINMTGPHTVTLPIVTPDTVGVTIKTDESGSRTNTVTLIPDPLGDTTLIDDLPEYVLDGPYQSVTVIQHSGVVPGDGFWEVTAESGRGPEEFSLMAATHIATLSGAGATLESDPGIVLYYWQCLAAGETITVEVQMSGGEWQLGTYGPVADHAGLGDFTVDGDAAGQVDQGAAGLQYTLDTRRLANATVQVDHAGRHTIVLTAADDGGGHDNLFAYAIFGYRVD